MRSRLFDAMRWFTSYIAGANLTVDGETNA